MKKITEAQGADTTTERVETMVKAIGSKNEDDSTFSINKHPDTMIYDSTSGHMEHVNIPVSNVFNKSYFP